MKGRGNSTTVTANAAMRLEINHLIKTKVIQEGKEITSKIKWTNGAEIYIHSVYTEKDQYIQLRYNYSNTQTKESELLDYKIYIGKVPSNLGKGFNLYFYCPESAIRCKVLYMAYNYSRFRCKQAYNRRIYYYSQTHSKVYRPTGQYLHFEKQLNELYEKKRTNTYKGKKTKRRERMNRLIDKKIEAERQKDKVFEKWLSSYLGFKL
jgi:hypothetical protein